jgi:organic radical activating enzyme
MMTKKMKIKDFKDSKVFCPAPFVHFFVHSSDVPKPCCAAEIYETWKTPKVVRGLRDEWESYHYTELRQKMINGEKSEICKRCYSGEETGGISDRTNFIDQYMRVAPDLEIDIEKGNEYGSPLDLDLRPGNLCNLQCRMCGPASSSQYNKEIKKNTKLINFIDPFDEDFESVWASERNLKFLLENIDKGIRRIKFLGGEPTIMPEVDRIMDYLIENKKTDIQLFFTSNMTNSNKKFLDKISQFESVMFNLSMDGIDKTLEYIRHPVNWYSLQKNIAKIAQLPNVEQRIDMSFTLQAYNLANLKETMEWAVEYNKKQENCKIYVSPENLTHPARFSYRSLPKKFRDNIVTDIINSDVFNHPDSNLTRKIKSRLEFILNDDEEYNIMDFAEATFRLDWSRQQHIKDYIPKLWEVLEPYYNVAKKRYLR